MQHILILGASSQIGQELTLRFAAQNSLTLVGRNIESMQLLRLRCLELGAKNVDLFRCDLADGAEAIIQELGDRHYDLLINLVAETSRIKDSEFKLGQLERYLLADLLVPIQLFQALVEASSSPLKIIFISSILAEVKSPDRLLYGSLKALQEICLRKLAAAQPKVKLLIVKVGKVIPHERINPESGKLADAIYRAHRIGKQVLNYGLTGFVYVALYYFQPLLFNGMVKFQRIVRAARGRA